MNYRETVDYLYTIQMFGTKLGLENIERLLELLGNPHKGLRFIHIAGTNGKGSVAAMLASIYQRAGLRTGLYTSPHLVSFCERIQVNREMISEDEVVRWVDRLRPLLEEVENQEGQRHPTFFEVVTALALLHFREQKVDLVIWETGLGGRLDATNVVTPILSVITNVHWDHQSYLGTTLDAIAREKAGIIKPGVPVVTATSELEALGVLEPACAAQGAPLIRVGRDIHARQVREDLRGQEIELQGTKRDYGVLRLPLIGSHQAVNAATAVAAVETADAVALPTVEHVRAGLLHAQWPGRFQFIDVLRPPVVIDGAHNIAGVVSLKTTISRHFPRARIILVLGILADKNYHVMCAELAPLADVLLAVRVKNARTADPAELARVCSGVNPKARIESVPELEDAYRRARDLAQGDDRAVIVIAGSLYLVGEAIDRLPLGLDKAKKQRSELTLQ